MTERWMVLRDGTLIEVTQLAFQDLYEQMVKIAGSAFVMTYMVDDARVYELLSPDRVMVRLP